MGLLKSVTGLQPVPPFTAIAESLDVFDVINSLKCSVLFDYLDGSCLRERLAARATSHHKG